MPSGHMDARELSAEVGGRQDMHMHMDDLTSHVLSKLSYQFLGILSRSSHAELWFQEKD